MLSINSHRNVEVLADKHPIVQGRKGERNLNLAMTAWHSSLQIIYAFLIVVVIMTIFITMRAQTTDNPYTSSLKAGREEPIPINLILILCVVFVVCIIVG